MSPEPQNLRADARRNYDLLVETATKMLALPDASLSFNELAKRAGLGIGTLYRHFPTKQALLEVIYADKLATLSINALAKLPADRALELWLQKLIDLAANAPGFSLFIEETMSDRSSPLFLTGSGLLKAAQKTGFLRNDINMQELLGLIKGIAESASDSQQIKKLLSVVMVGLRTAK